MRFKIQLTVINPEDGQEVRDEITMLEKQNNQLEDIDLALEESKTILKTLQEKIIQYQTEDFIDAKRTCEHCQKVC